MATTGNITGFVDNPKLPPVGDFTIMLDFDVDTTYSDTIADRLNLCVMPEGRYLDYIDIFDNEDGDTGATPTLDADIVLVQGVDVPSDAGTETIIYNAGTRWQAASTTVVKVWANTYLKEYGYNGHAYLRWKVNTVAATGVDDFNIRMIVHGH